MDPAIDLTGRQLGRYEIRSLLGRGGMGAVYRAYDTNLGRNVAIKILPPHLVADPERVRRFVQEARSASALNHPHVVSIHEIGEEDSIHYIAMELVEGTTLREHLGGLPLEVTRALTIGREIAEAIGAAHEAGVVHRDLKPENIIIATSGYVKVLDFGLAKLRRDSTGVGANEATQVKSTEPGQIMGTVGYMSPEQAEGRPVDHRSDIFSLGCILYEMVSGRSPFRGRSPVDTMHNIVHAEPPPLHTLLPDVPVELQRITDKALAKSPDERYQSAKDLAVDLKRLSRDLDSSTSFSAASRSAQTVVLPRPKRKLRFLFPILVAIAVAVVLTRPRGERREEAATPKTPLAIRRLTATGNAIGAAVSPDGKYIAYASSEQGQQGLWLRQIATGQDLQLVPPAPVGMWGHAFSPDGSSIYYAYKGPEHPDGILHSIAILGGRPQKILDTIDSPPTFSPDGKRIAFVRGAYPTKDESALMTANADGSDLRVLAKRAAPEHFYPIFYTGPSWSPDGKRIAASLVRRGERAGGRILEVDAATGATRDLSSGWGQTQQLAWMPGGDGLLVVGTRGGNTMQLWRVPFPSGEPQQITNDLFDYRMVSVTADGSTIVAIAADVDADLWLIPAAGGDAPRRLRTGKAVGLGGLSVSPDGSIAHSSLDSGQFDIWITDTTGASARQMTNEPRGEAFPRFTPDGKSIVFGGFAPGAMIRRIAADGSQTRATDIAPSSEAAALTPDGLTLLVTSPTGLAKVPISGGTPTPIVSYNTSRHAVSPDGTRIACYCQVDPAKPLQLCIIPMTGGPPEKTFSGAGMNFRSMIKWTADGRALYVNTMPNDRRNIWLFPLDGGEPKALTSFSDQLLFQFDVMPDGKSFIASRGEMTRDAVMITGFR